MIALLVLFACGGTPEAPPEPSPEAVTTPAAPATPPAEPAPAAPTAEAPAAEVPAAAPAGAPTPATPAATTLPAGFEACRDEWKKGGCTRELKPACGVKADGSTAGGANPCVACQDGAVGWKDGACP